MPGYVTRRCFYQKQKKETFFYENKTMKTNNPTNKDNDNEVLYHLDTRISAHNAGIGSTAPYTVIGFGRLSNGDFVVISEQPHIQDARMATREEISDEMQKMGYDLDGKDSFSDQDHFITDINPKNVLVSKEGTFHFIDTIYDIFNVNDEDSNRLSGIIQRQKIEDKSPLADIVNGFYSNTENALLQVPQEKMSGSKWKSQLLSRGANSDEMKWTTLLNYLEDNKDKSVSKNDIRQYLKDNRIQVVEVVKDGGISEEEIDTLLNDEVGQDMTRDEARAFLENDERQDDTKFSQYQLEGEKENYKEVLVTLPSNPKYQKELNRLSKKYNVEPNYVSLRGSQATDSELEVLRSLNSNKETFKSSHFDEPNILVHLRMNTRTDAEGNKVLFLEEVQSDWGQKGKKEGFETPEKKDKLKKLQDDASAATQKFNEIEEELNKQYSEKKKEGESRYDLRKRDSDFNKLAQEYAPAEQRMDESRSAFDLFQVDNRGKVPAAPFISDTNAWTKLALKVALKESIKQSEQMQRTAFEKLVDEKMDWVEARMKKLGKLEVKCP